MSTRSSHESGGYVFSDFLACEACFRDYDPTSSSVSFWITACGHFLCDSHRPRDYVHSEVADPDSPCIKCGTANVSFARFGSDLSLEVAHYFEPGSGSMEKVLQATRYQEQYLFNLITFFKEKTLKQKSTLDGVQSQLQRYDEAVQRVAELEQEVDTLRNQLGRGRMGPPSLPGSTNGDGRRRLNDVEMHNSDPGQETRRARSSSNSLTAVLPPNRLSIKPSQRAPSRAARANDVHVERRGGGSGSRENDPPVPMDVARPSSAFDRFAYNPTSSNNPSRRIISTPRPQSVAPRGAGAGPNDPPHEVIQLQPHRAEYRHQHRSSFLPPAMTSPARASSRMSGRSGGGGGPIRAMPPPAGTQMPQRAHSVVHSHRNPPQQPVLPSRSQPLNHLPPPSRTPRPGTASMRAPFVPLASAGLEDYDPNPSVGPSRSASRAAAGRMIEWNGGEEGGYEAGGGMNGEGDGFEYGDG